MYKYYLFLLIAVICTGEGRSLPEPSTAIRCFGNQRTGYINQAGPISQPSLSWLYESPRNGNSHILLADGRLIMIHDGMLCIDSRDGENLWTSPQIFGPFAISDGVVYSQHRDSLVYADTELVGIDIETGEIIWRWDLKEVRNFLIADSILYVSCKSTWSRTASIYPDKVIAMKITNLRNVVPLWECELSEYRMNSMSLIDTVLFASLEDSGSPYLSEGIAAISTLSGDLLWRIERDSITSRFLPITEEALFFRLPDSLKAVSIIDGSLIWAIPDSLLCDPVLREGSLFYLSADGELVEVSASTGAEIDSSNMPLGTLQNWSTISLTNNGIYILSGRCILKLDYNLILEWIYSRFNASSLIIHEGNLYLSSSARLFCLSDPFTKCYLQQVWNSISP